MKKLILNIPHSTPCLDFSKWKDPEAAKAEHDKWTDWHTDAMFSILGSFNEGKVEKVVFGRSRYEVDVERLLHDPMEGIGQGIIYDSLKNGQVEVRDVSVDDSVELTRAYVNHWNKVASLCTGDGLLIDCHSFPSDYKEAMNANGEMVDVCIGFNNDNTHPGEEVIRTIKREFELHGYKVGINSPFSNAFAPVPNFPSVMIELRKGIYMDEGTLKLLSGAYKVNQVLNEIYRILTA